MKKTVICCDFDGTITAHDLLDILVDYNLGEGTSNANDEKVLKGAIMGSIIKETFESISMSFDDAIKLIDDNTHIDEHFKKFYELCSANNIDFYIVSSGFKTLIKHYLPFIPESNIFANDVDIVENRWIVKLCDNTGLNKKKVISQMNDKKIIYIGDGVSDICVADMVDILYVKAGKSLHQHCINNSIKHLEFETFSDILKNVKLD